MKFDTSKILPYAIAPEPPEFPAVMTGKPAQPTPLEVLLLQAGLWDPKRARTAWEEFCGKIDDIEVLDVGLYGLFPILAANLEEFGSTLLHADYYQSSLRHSWAKSHRFLSLILPVLRGLKEGGVDYLLLRGVALSYAYYGHGGARPNIDLGLLLPPAQVAKAFHLLLRLGCLAKVPIRPEDEAGLIRYGYESVWLLPNKMEFRVRWHLVQGCLYEADGARVWEQAQDCALPGLPTRTPGTINQFVEICLADYHGAYLLRLADAAMVLREGKPDGAALEARARSLQRLQPVREMILELAHYDLGVSAEMTSHWRGL